MATLVDPADGNPLRRHGDVVESVLQDADRLLDVVVDDLKIEIMFIGLLQKFALSCQSLQTRILQKQNARVDKMLAGSAK